MKKLLILSVIGILFTIGFLSTIEKASATSTSYMGKCKYDQDIVCCKPGGNSCYCVVD